MAAAANPYSPRPAAAGVPTGAGPVSPAGLASTYGGIPRDPAMTPASLSGMAPPPAPDPTQRPGFGPMAAPGSNPSTPSSWASTAAAAPEKKPSAMRKFFSYIWRGGSSPDEDKTVHNYRDMSTGRTDLRNARPWEPPAP